MITIVNTNFKYGLNKKKNKKKSSHVSHTSRIRWPLFDVCSAQTIVVYRSPSKNENNIDKDLHCALCLFALSKEI